MAEYWDIYDADRIKTNRKHLRGEPIADGDYHLVVNIWIYNSQGKVLLTPASSRHSLSPQMGVHRWFCSGRRRYSDRCYPGNPGRNRPDSFPGRADSCRTGTTSSQFSGYLYCVQGCPPW